MKEDSLFAIKWASVACVVLAIAVMVAFWSKRHDPMLFAGPGRLDFSAHLAGEYLLHRTSGTSIMISPEAFTDGTPHVPSLVVECATDGRFIVAKRKGLKASTPSGTSGIEDPSVVDYWVLDTKIPGVHGPLTKEAYTARRKELGISESLVLKDVYEFRPASPK